MLISSMRASIFCSCDCNVYFLIVVGVDTFTNFVMSFHHNPPHAEDFEVEYTESSSEMRSTYPEGNLFYPFKFFFLQNNKCRPTAHQM